MRRCHNFEACHDQYTEARCSSTLHVHTGNTDQQTHAPRRRGTQGAVAPPPGALGHSILLSPKQAIHNRWTQRLPVGEWKPEGGRGGGGAVARHTILLHQGHIEIMNMRMNNFGAREKHWRSRCTSDSLSHGRTTKDDETEEPMWTVGREYKGRRLAGIGWLSEFRSTCLTGSAG